MSFRLWFLLRYSDGLPAKRNKTDDIQDWVLYHDGSI